MTQRQFDGRSAAEAAIKACETLGVTRSALRYEVLSDTGEKLARRVVIRVDVPEKAAAAEPPATAAHASPVSAPPPRRPARPAGFGAPRPAPAQATREGNFAVSHEPDMPVRRNRAPERVNTRGDRRGRGGESRGGRGERSGNRPERTAHAPAEAVAAERPARTGRGRRGDAQPREPRADARASGTRERTRGRQRERQPSAGGGRPQDDNGIDALLSMEASQIAVVRRPALAPQGGRAARAVQVAGDLVRHMGLDLQPTLVAEDTAEIHIDLVGSDESRAIGRKGEVLLALQFVLNRILSRSEAEADGEQVVVLDAGGYRERRRVALQELASKLARRALEERKAVRLSPMSAHDRRIFHMALKEIEGITTRSEGEGLYRNLLIIPAEFC